MSIKLTFRYVGALLVVAGLLVAGQYFVQLALDRQQGDARVVNLAGRQRMLSQRICMLLLAIEARGADPATLAELERAAGEWERSQNALQRGDNSELVQRLFAAITDDHQAMLAAARSAVAARDGRAFAPIAQHHQDSFLVRMDEIVASYEQEARARVVRLRRTELALFALLLAVLVLEGLFVFRPAVRGLRVYLAERDQAQQALLQVGDREEKRIAQDLHDGLGQHLVGVAYLVKSMRQDLAGGPHEARIEEIGRLLAESIAQTRGLARSLYSHTLEADGLAAALRELALHTEHVFGVACHAPTTDVAIAMPIRGHLYRIAREAVLNAAKHAKATSIAIEIRHDAATVTIIVRDDGVGIGTPSGDGMGLRLMESRAKMTGATLSVAPASGRGTIVTCTAPITGVEA